MKFHVGETVTSLTFDKFRPGVILALNEALGTAIVAIGTTKNGHDPRDCRTYVEAGSSEAKQMSLHRTTCFRSTKIAEFKLEDLEQVARKSRCPRPLFAQLHAMMPRAMAEALRKPGYQRTLPPPDATERRGHDRA